MAFLRTARDLSFRVCIPRDVDTLALLSLLQDHEALVRLSPFVAHVERVPADSEDLRHDQRVMDEGFSRAEKGEEEEEEEEEGAAGGGAGGEQEEGPVAENPSSEWKTYRVSETVPYYGAITFVASFRDREAHGCDSVVHAPAGLVMRDTWRVLAHGDQRLLREECSLYANVLLMPFVLWNFGKAHRDMHRKLMEKAKRHNGPT